MHTKWTKSDGSLITNGDMKLFEIKSMKKFKQAFLYGALFGGDSSANGTVGLSVTLNWSTDDTGRVYCNLDRSKDSKYLLVSKQDGDVSSVEKFLSEEGLVPAEV